MSRYRATFFPVSDGVSKDKVDRIGDSIKCVVESFSGDISVRMYIEGGADCVEIKAQAHLAQGTAPTQNGEIVLYKGPIAALTNDEATDKFLIEIARKKMKQDFGGNT